MPTSEAHLKTERADRYLNQLCEHAQKIHRLGHRPRLHHSHPGGARPPAKVQVERSDTLATLDFGWGRCNVEASSDTLVLRAEAPDEDGLQRVQNIVAADIGRFGKRERLTVDWQCPPAPTVQSGEAG